MKKQATIILFLMTSLVANAQEKFDALTDREFMFNVLHSVIAVIVIYLLIVFILTMVRLLMNYNLKKSLLENGATAEMIAQILPSNGTGSSEALKWFTVLFAIGLGLIAVTCFQPVGIHSAIIMVFSVAIGFLAYHFLLRRLK
jgi:hypothetical protein